MSIPLQITIRNLDKSPALEERIQQKAEKLQTFFDKIISCHVIVEETQKSKHKGNLYAVHIHVCVPGKDLTVSHIEADSVHVALRDSFDKMRRQLEEYANQLRNGETKILPDILRGKIDRMFEDFGFIVAQDGMEYYFHADNVVHPSFAGLEVDMDVQFVPAMGSEGRPQAHRVSLPREA